MTRIKRTLTQDQMYLMANLSGRSTGLPMVIWVSPGYGAKHTPRIEIQRQYGDRSTGRDVIAITISDKPRIVAGSGLSQDDLELVTKFILLNKNILLNYWSDANTEEMCEGIKKI